MEGIQTIESLRHPARIHFPKEIPLKPLEFADFFFRRYRKLSVEDVSRLARSIQEHQSIVDAIASGDADIAAALMQTHIENAKNNMIKRFDYHG